MGFILSHEHLGTNAAGIRQTFPEFIDRSGMLEQAVAELKEAYGEGLRTIIDVSTIDLGRDVSPDDIASLYVREIEVGIEGTGIKAEIIKVTSDRGGVTQQREVLPFLRELGASEEEIHPIMEENPRRFFEGS